MIISSAELTTAAPEWSLNITATRGTYTSTCTFGTLAGATSGYDQSYDLVVPPAPPTGVYSYLYYPDNSASPLDLQSLSTSLIQDTGTVWNYTLKIQNKASTGTVVLSWNSASVTTAYMTLIPTSGAYTNMKTTSQYSFNAEKDTVYTFIISASTTTPDPTATPAPTPTPIPTASTLPTSAPTNSYNNPGNTNPTSNPSTTFPTTIPTPKPIEQSNTLMLLALVSVVVVIVAVLVLAIRKK